MRTSSVIRTVLLMVACCATAEAGPAFAQRTTCGDCKKAATEAGEIRKQLDDKQAELRQLQMEERINSANANNARQLRQDAVRRGDTDAAREHEQSIKDLQSDNSANREEQFKAQQEIRRLNEEIQDRGRDVEDCSQRCFETDPALPSGAGVKVDSTIPTTDDLEVRGASVPPLKLPPPCDDCKVDVETLRKEHQELERRAKEANATGELDRLRDFEAQRRKMRDLQRKADGCRKVCTPPTTSWLSNPKVIGGISGGAALIALTTLTGGDSVATPTPLASAPLQPAPPAPMPAPTPAPAPTPTPTPAPPPAPTPNLIDQLMGTYWIRSCVCELDQGGHDLFLRLCQQLRQLRFTRNGTTDSIRIDGEAPFMASDFILDANTRAIDGDARGAIGPVGATLHYAGEFAPPPAFIVNLLLTYTINGTNVRYRVSAAKQ